MAMAVVMGASFCACDDVDSSFDDPVTPAPSSVETAEGDPGGDGSEGGDGGASVPVDTDVPLVADDTASMVADDGVISPVDSADSAAVVDASAEGDTVDTAASDTPAPCDSEASETVTVDGCSDTAAALDVDTSVVPTETVTTDEDTNVSEPAPTDVVDGSMTDTAAVETDSTDDTGAVEAGDTATESDAIVATDTDAATDTSEVSDTAESIDTEPCVPTLVINEVDYDVPGKDTAEFVELYNPAACDMPLDGIVLILVNGSDMEEYRRIALLDAGVATVAAGAYLLIHGEELVVPSDVPAVVMTLASGFIQNGPDGLALFDENTQTVLDAFCYESPMSEVWFDGVEAPFSLVEGEINPDLADSGSEGISISRIPNGGDTQNAAVDWAVSTATPGAANLAL